MKKKILQFGYKRPNVKTELWALGFEEGQTPVVDCRVIPNPFSKAKNDTDRKLLVKRDPQFEGLVQAGLKALSEGDLLAVGCEYGRHRSGTVVEEIMLRFDGDVSLVKMPAP